MPSIRFGLPETALKSPANRLFPFRLLSLTGGKRGELAMQRQSLGSPASKLQIHAVKEEKLDRDENRSSAADEEEDDDKKAEKHLRSTSRAQRSIHLIPILVFCCFLVLYLVSHDPSQVDLANAGGLERHFRRKDSEELQSVHRVFELDKSEILEIRSHRSLQEVGRGVRRSRPFNRHRKLGNF